MHPNWRGEGMTVWWCTHGPWLVPSSNCRALFGRTSTSIGCRVCVPVWLLVQQCGETCYCQANACHPFSINTTFKCAEVLLCCLNSNLFAPKPLSALTKRKAGSPLKSEDFLSNLCGQGASCSQILQGLLYLSLISRNDKLYVTDPETLRVLIFCVFSSSKVHSLVPTSWGLECPSFHRL